VRHPVPPDFFDATLQAYSVKRGDRQAHEDSPVLRFVLTIGVVNLFADMTYEGGANINGPFLGTLGARAAAIGIIAAEDDDSPLPAP
jgi:hypothetical protein